MNSFKMKNRILAALLCLVTVGGIGMTALLQGSKTAEASTSLPAIVNLKSSGQEFIILEIVPDVSQAAFAWYVGGSEPVNSKKLATAYSDDTTSLVNAYASTTSMLQNQGYLLGTAENEPVDNNVLQYLGQVSAGTDGSVLGGFENNEWFHRYVLDWTEEEDLPKVKVMTVSPANVTIGHVDLADMIVISGGYYYPDTATTPMGFSANLSENLTNDVTNEIISRVSSSGFDGTLGLPLILDRRAYNVNANSDLNSNRLFHEILKSDPQTTKSGVYGSTFFYSAVNSDAEMANSVLLEDGSRLGLDFVGSDNLGFLVNTQFNAVFNDEVVKSSFSDVLKSIQNENLTRGGVGLLSEDITMAGVIQYLVGGAGMSSSQVVQAKSAVTILAIQPTDSNTYARYSSESHDIFGQEVPTSVVNVALPIDATQEASLGEVSWEQLELWTGVARKNITVVVKSVEEFVKSSEDLSTNYDMIYIGNNISGENYGVYQEATQFGVLGDAQGATYFASFEGDTQHAAASYVASTRDITQVKHDALVQYVAAGRPVVLAPYLCAGFNIQTTNTVPSSVTVDSDSYMFKFLSAVSNQSNVYRQDILIVGADGVEGTADDSEYRVLCESAVHIPSLSLESFDLAVGDVSTDSTTWSTNVKYVDGSFVMEYVFQVRNKTTSGAAGVAYTLAVNLDLDNDGVYETTGTHANVGSYVLEQLQTDTTGALVLNAGEPIREQEVYHLNTLSQDQFYRFSLTLNNSINGILPFKVTVSGSDNSSPASVEDFCFIPLRSPKTTSVLQIITEDGFSLEDDANFSGAKSLVSADFPTDFAFNDSYQITLKTMEVSEFEEATVDLDSYSLIMVEYGISNSAVLTALNNTVASQFYYGMENFSTIAGVETLTNDKFTSYPYVISSTIYSVGSFNSRYYSDIDVSNGSNASLLVDMIAMMSFYEEVEVDTSGAGFEVDRSAFKIYSDAEMQTEVTNLELTYAILNKDNQLPVYFTIPAGLSEFKLVLEDNLGASYQFNYFSTDDQGFSSEFDMYVTKNTGDAGLECMAYLMPYLTENISLNKFLNVTVSIMIGDTVHYMTNFSLELVGEDHNYMAGSDYFYYNPVEYVYSESTSGSYVRVGGEYVSYTDYVGDDLLYQLWNNYYNPLSATLHTATHILRDPIFESDGSIDPEKLYGTSDSSRFEAMPTRYSRSVVDGTGENNIDQLIPMS